MLAALIKQALANVSINSVRPKEPDCIEPLDLDLPKAAQALHTKQLAWDFG
jgi:hypothetical protein